ncbi:probable bifunctional methylthioribulose-1-phosphate dehydratase/enolase-phosphatase E1 isoform X5 [Panicum virgatum]|nr:probable bifunctional methylthioribulose-1-phosphate dehydratase/enolase-phosphatase E1 isoform X5 [Panicum virgatum]
MVAADMYVFSADGKVLSEPAAKPWPNKPPKCTDCAPLFMKAYQMRGAGAVIHSHGIETCIASMLDPGAKEFRMTHMEMLKAIKGHGYRDELVIPIIENTPYEYELTDSLSEAIAAYPKATAVLVRNHGIFVWGDSWISAKTQAESYHYLLDAAIKLYQLGIDWTTPEHGPVNRAKRSRSILNPGIPNECHAAEPLKVNNSLLPIIFGATCVVLDIEGTTTPISFVTDVMFPYARDNVRKHLTSTFYSEETKEDIKLLRVQIEDDLRNGIPGAVPVPPDEAGKEEVINSLVANVESMIEADWKVTSLKQLQGHIWRTGFEREEIHGVIFEDVPEALKNWNSRNIKVYIYSSGSREAQRLLFGNTEHGDLRPFLCGYFDTTIGNKKETRSYFEIAQTLRVDSPSQILFITDVFQEAIAAKNAGFEVVISIRPGNAPVPENHGFRTIKSLSEVCER